MTDTRKQRVPASTIIIYYILFFLAWIAAELLVLPFFDAQLPDAAGEWAGEAVKIAVWTVPALLLIHKYSGALPVSLRGMFTDRVSWLKYLPVVALLAAYVLLGAYVQKGAIWVQDGFRAEELIGAVFCVGITEEVVFRGWLMNAFESRMKLVPAVILNAVLFLAIHFPLWIRKGIFVDMFLGGGFAGILLLSVIFSLVFVKSRSIWLPMLLHMFYNLMVIMFLG